MKINSVSKTLITASKYGNELEISVCLKELGCDALSSDEDGITGLMHAAYQGHGACVKLLLPVSDPLCKDNNDLTALIRAASAGHFDCVQLLLPVSDPHAKDKRGMTALMRSATYGHFACTQILLPVSDISAQDRYGRDARTSAAQGGYDEVVKLFDAFFAKEEQAALSLSTGPGLSKKIAPVRI